MCGISGIYRFDKEKVNKIEIKKMSDALIHRGPDDEGDYIKDHLALGHRRLSILDLSPKGKQPMTIDDNLWITFNGEIYNYAELRKELKKEKIVFKSNTDTEVILHLYKKNGLPFLHKLRGMFAFAIYDKNKNTLFCARDRFGIKPFYYFKNKSKFIFASEIKALFTHEDITAEPNDKMIYDFLTFNRTDHEEETCFQNIYNLRPGHFIFIDNLKFSIKQWYRLPEVNDSFDQSEDYINKFNALLKKSVNLHMRSDVSVGSCLSGGLDSSTLVSLMREEIGKEKKIYAFSAIYKDNWEKDEKRYIDEVDKHCNLINKFTTPDKESLLKDIKKLIYHQEEPFGSTSIFAGWKVMELANKNKIKVLLDGQGSDEILGYDYMAAFYFYELFGKSKYLKLIEEVFYFIKKQKFGTNFTLKLFLYLLLPRKLKKIIIKQKNNWLSKEFVKNNIKKSNFQENFFNLSNFNQSVINHLKYKLTHLLRFEDKNSMAFSIETRVPFLDHKLVEYAINIPAGLKINHGEVKFILKKAMKNNLPKIVIERNDKIGFETPQDRWFRSDMMFYFFEEFIITHKYLKKYFDLKKITIMLKQQHNSTHNWGENLWKFLCVGLWYDTFILKK